MFLVFFCVFCWEWVWGVLVWCVLCVLLWRWGGIVFIDGVCIGVNGVLCGFVCVSNVFLCGC